MNKIITLFLCSFSIFIHGQTVGLLQYESNSFEGYTLLAPSGSEEVFLIDNCGKMVNSWQTNYLPGQVTYLLENGNLLRSCRISSGFNSGGSGGRIQLQNWDGELIWAHNYSSEIDHQHHDLEYLPNGNILILAWSRKTVMEALEAGKEVPNEVWSEKIIEVEMIGTDEINVVWEWDIWDHLVQDFDETKMNYGVVADHPELININYNNFGGDWIHANAIDYNAELDQIIINSRYMSEFYIIDHSTTTEEAASHSGGNSNKGGDFLYRWGNPQVYERGGENDRQLYGQHDVNWVPAGYPDAGKIICFNNGYNRPIETYSSIDIINPPIDELGNYFIAENLSFGPLSAEWIYDGGTDNGFYSSRISGVQRLKNGNTFICDGQQGNLFEIDQNDSIVWRYINPISAGTPINQGDIPFQNDCFRAYRYASDFPAFIGVDLIPGDPVEQYDNEPYPDDCAILSSVSESETFYGNTLEILGNPFQDFLVLKNNASAEVEIEILSLTGFTIFKGWFKEEDITINANKWPKSLYLVQSKYKDHAKNKTQKIIKQ